jgi:molybdopterin-guanine dinucleotide biosynthesis protein A
MGYSGAVLAGGASKRFGEDKALFPYRGKPLLQWVLESLQGAEERFIVANRPYEGFGVPVYPDLLPGADSLSGLHSALSHARFPWVAVAACDLPFLIRDYWDFLYEKALASPYPVVVAYSGEGHLEPLAALYHKDCLPQVEGQIRAGDFLLRRIPETLGATYVPFAEVSARFGERVFLNANRKEELP